ncbi:hypothetical protein IKS57_03015 [bacterium]|nr:hypothetical protein [bacterium]
MNEVKQLLKTYPHFLNYNAAKAIGYRTIVNSILNNKQLDFERIVFDTNHYVKHQLS